jgi:DNA repair exonuclease SbcCD nuclease subunit
MKDLKTLHFADVHCRDKDLDEIKPCLAKIVETAKEEEPDIIINAGDTFDSRDIRLDSLSAKAIFTFFADLADIAPVLVVLGTPSHDGRTVEVLQHVRANYQVWVSGRPEQLYIDSSRWVSNMPCSNPLAIVSMIPTPTKQFFAENSMDIQLMDQAIGNMMGPVFAGFGAKASEYICPHIVVGHWQVGGAYISESQQLIGRDIEISKDQIALANADLVCLGHIHYHQQVAENAFYSGSIYRQDWSELEDKGVYIHKISESGLTSEFITTPTRNLKKLEYDLTDQDMTIERVLNDSFLENMEYDCVRMTLKVYQDESGKIDREALTARLTEAGAKEADIRIIRVPRENVRSEAILKLKTLREKVIERARLKGEDVPESILLKADMLESVPSDQIISSVAI